MEKQTLVEACAVPIQKCDKQPIATTISEVIDCVMKEYAKHPTLSESKVMEVFKSLERSEFVEDGDGGNYGSLALQQSDYDKAAKQICSTVDIAQVEDEVRRIMSNYWDMKHPEANDFVNELMQSLGSERSTQPAAVSEHGCKNYEADDSTAMNCKWCGDPKWVHDSSGISLNQKGEGAPERYDKARVYYNTEMGLTGLNASKPELTVINKALHIAAGLLPKPEGGKR